MTLARAADLRSLRGNPILNSKTGKVAAAFAAWEGGRSLWNSAQETYRKNFVYTVAVSETDDLYDAVHRWLLEVVPSEKQRALAASSGQSSGKYSGSPFDEDDDDLDPEALRRSGLVLSFNDRKSRRVNVGGHVVSAVIRRPGENPDQGGSPSNPADKRTPMEPRYIEFICHTKGAQDAVIKHLQTLVAKKAERNPALRIVNPWGHWDKRADIPLRSLDSVVLPKEQKDAVVEDLRGFLADEARYVDLAIPWHRGYMLHGPPGTGKTSFVKALASEFRLDLWYVSLGDLKEEASLIGLLSSVKPRSIVLIEDVDTLKITHDRAEVGPEEGGGGRISLSSLLNALDGVATPHGLISFMTTNVFDSLDPALVRAGRMDRIEELGMPRAREACELYRRFYGMDLPGLDPSDEPLKVTQATLSEALKRNLHDPEGGARAMLEAIG